MQILTSEGGEAFIGHDYPVEYYCELLKDAYSHEDLAKIIADHGLKTFMTITVADRLADEHWDDPEYLHKTNHIMVCEALQNVRRERMNRYFTAKGLSFMIERHKFPTKEFNYKEDDGRAFKFRLEDELFSYQERCDLIDEMISILETSKYKLDEEGFVLSNEDEDPIPETDEGQIERNRAILMAERKQLQKKTTLKGLRPGSKASEAKSPSMILRNRSRNG
jgi:hypothetical protein